MQEPKPQHHLGAWEESILGTRPYEELSKQVADFLFKNISLHPDSGDIIGRGVQFEIEAKMGLLIDRDTNERVEKFIGSECILHDTGRLAFKSSMTAVSSIAPAKMTETNFSPFRPNTKD